MQSFVSFKTEIVGADSGAPCIFFKKFKVAPNSLLLLINAATSVKQELIRGSMVPSKTKS